MIQSYSSLLGSKHAFKYFLWPHQSAMWNGSSPPATSHMQLWNPAERSKLYRDRISEPNRKQIFHFLLSFDKRKHFCFPFIGKQTFPGSNSRGDGVSNARSTPWKSFSACSLFPTFCHCLRFFLSSSHPLSILRSSSLLSFEQLFVTLAPQISMSRCL